MLHFTEEEAVHYMQNLLESSQSAFMPALVEHFHKMAQVSRAASAGRAFVSTGFYRAPQGFMGLHGVLQGSSGFYRVLWGSTGFYRAPWGSTAFYRAP